MGIGIDLGGTKIEGIALDGSLEVARSRVDTPRDDYEATLRAITELVTALQQRIPNPESRLPAEALRAAAGIPTVGIGIPGTVSSSTGLVKNANSTWLIGRPLQHDLEERLGRPVRIANDANCFAVSEATDGAAVGAPVVFGVIAGTGVGGGLVVNGQILGGANGIAGEWGHNPLPWTDADDAVWPPCYCGQRGCIETFLSGPGMTADHERFAGVRRLPREIVKAAADGDVDAEATLRRYERRMARALASVINVLDPDVIVLGGGLSNIERLYVNVPRLWSEFIFAAEREPFEPVEPVEPFESRIPNPESRVRTRLVPARHGDASGVRGAAWLWPVSP